ncbi:hypothetical protein CYA_1861 [Synechococcus sp. JA-3-3Ab]|nr:hypothetical protein CYA_1861 [Synechococcus sp. JA-3-3Ab]
MTCSSVNLSGEKAAGIPGMDQEEEFMAILVPLGLENGF